MSGTVESFMLLPTLFLMLKSLLVTAVNPMPMRRCSSALLACSEGPLMYHLKIFPADILATCYSGCCFPSALEYH